MSDDAAAAIALRRTQSLTAIVQNELERMILSGELKAGERLNEQALSARLGVSRGPIREATRALERAGLLTAILNQGFFVREISPEEASEIYDVRAVVFGFACQRLAAIITAEQISVLRDFVDHMDDAIDRNDGPGYYQLNLQFHNAIMDFAQHERAKQIYDSLIKETHLTRQRSLDLPGRMRESNNEHRRLVEAINDHQTELARHLSEQHGLSGRRRWLETVEGCTTKTQ